MRDPARIRPLLRAIEKLWLKSPDLRLGQLIVALNRGDPFYKEDDDLFETVIRLLESEDTWQDYFG